jgi:SAM-dependent methyltransferase
MVEFRDDRHIALLFVDKPYHRRGIAGELVRRGIEVCCSRHPGLCQVTVNSSPSAVPIYHKVGFAATGCEQEVHGIRFTPMVLDVAGGQALAESEPSPMRDFYTRYYAAISASSAYAKFCGRAYGRDFGQHGFADMAQVDALLGVTRLVPGDRVLDLGCGNGGISEYISDMTGAHVTGLDFIPEAIRQAQERTATKRSRLTFRIGDIRELDLPPRSFDALVSIDTLYFTELTRSIPQMSGLLASGGQIAIFYSHGADPENPIATFQRQTLPSDRAPLGEVLARQGLHFRAWDFTEADYRHAQLTRQALEELNGSSDECVLF